MDSSLKNKFRVVGLDAARIFSDNLSPDIYGIVAEFILKELREYFAVVRLYTLDTSEKYYKEIISCDYKGLEPGYDSIPIYHVPDGIYQSGYVHHNERDIMIALRTGDNIIGLLDLKVNLPIPENFLESTKLLADTLAIGLSNNLFRSNNLRSRVLTDVVIDINTKIQKVTDLNILIEDFMSITINQFRFDRATIFLFDKNEDLFFSKCFNEQGQSYIVYTEPDFPGIYDGYYSLENTTAYWFPLTTNNRRVGFILFDNIYSLYKLADSELDFLRILCSQLSSVIDNVRLMTDLKESALYDKLTGLHNRRYFEQVLERFNTREVLPLSIIIGDVNGLKVTNDVFGHQTGDELLISISHILQKSCRENDVVVRWGGDEFVILLPSAVEADTEHIIKKIKELCSEHSNHKIQLSISLGSNTRYSLEEDIDKTIKIAEDKMYRHKLLETKSFRHSLISSLKETLLDKCQETAGHAERMTKIAASLGNQMELFGSELDDLKLLAMLHDIGKVAVADSILSKAGPLNEEEWKEVKKHSETGYRIAQASFELSQIANYILCHHERWDGNGYPLGKKGQEIPRLSRIIAVIDAYDVMTHQRPYKDPVSHQEALKELDRYAGTQFDPEVVSEFKKLELPL